MKYLFSLLLLWSCQANTLDITLTNKSLRTNDMLNVSFKNNSSENYLFYFESKKLRYFPEAPNSLNLEILKKNKPVDVVFSSDPLYILNEDGNSENNLYTKEKDFNDDDLLLLVPSKETVTLKIAVIDSIDDYGAKNYPILENKTSYKTSLKLKLDSSLISKKVMEKINRMRKEKKVKLFQGQINSNTILLKLTEY